MRPFLLAAHMGDLWLALPLVIAISLVYSGTRYEDMHEILWRALRMGLWTVFFLVLFFVLLLLISWWL
jgi:uncharacterized membrane protein YbhN (UPF0104 family)